MKDKITGRNDDDITVHHHPAQRDILILVDNPGNDIRTSGTSVVTEYHPNAQSQHSGPYDTRHKVLSRTQQLRQISLVILKQHLKKPKQERQHKDGINGLYTETRPQYLQCESQKNGIDHKIGNLYFHPCRIIDNRGNTGYPTRGYLIWKHEQYPCQ